MGIRFSMSGRALSGQHEAAISVYKRIDSKTRHGGVWLVANQENEGDNIYWGYEANKGHPRSDGMGGAVIEFELVDGGSVKIQGPWHSNADSLFADTGYDCRDKYFTQGIVAERRTSVPKSWDYEYDGIIHHDKKRTLGAYRRIMEIAKQWCLDNKADCYYCMRSRGGGSSGPMTYEGVLREIEREKRRTA